MKETFKLTLATSLALAVMLGVQGCDSKKEAPEQAATTAAPANVGEARVGDPAVDESTIDESTASVDAEAADMEELQALAEEAYIFAYPLVMNYRTMYMQAIKQGGFGEWLHLEPASPADQDIVTPNNDTPYSYAWLDLRAEPWVLTIPEIGDERFYTSQWDDLWGFVLGNAGSVTDGNGGTTVMLAAPGWDGELPEGVDRVITGESEFLGSLTRTQWMSTDEDLVRVKEIQSQYQLQPLHEYTNSEAPEAAPEVDWIEWTEGDEMTNKYWDYAALALRFVKKNPQDAEMYEKLAKLGITPGQGWDKSSLGDEGLAAMKAAVVAARAELKDRGNKPVNAADLFGDRDTMTTDYMDRALGVYMGIFANTIDQSFYYSIATDADGQLFDGAKNDYTFTFSAEQLPPVEYFWSLTMYKLPERWLIENPIKRYNISSATPGLTYNDDGSLTIRISADEPDNVKTANWLPTHEGPFWVVLRTYGPGQAIQDGEYQPPAPTASAR